MTASSSPDPRADRLRAAVLHLVSGQPAGEAAPRTPEGDPLDQALAGVAALAEEIAAMRAFEAETRKRVGELSEMMRALSSLDFSKTAYVSENDTILDGFAVGLNVLAAELSSSTISKGYADTILESMTDALLVVWPDGRVRTANKAARDLFERSAEELSGQPLTRLLPDASVDTLMEAGGVSGVEMRCLSKGGREIPVLVAASVMLDTHREPLGLVLVARDLTETKRSEEEHWKMREQVRRKAVLLEELSTPLLPVAPGVLVMPLIGSLDEDRSSRLALSLLQGIARQQASLAILDITGLRTVGAEAVSGILRAVQSARMIGAQVVLTGVRPEVARMLAELDADLSGVVTFGSLERGIRYALRGGVGAR